MKWTSEQQQAIDLRGTNILVSAAAGSGKTALLIERIRKLVVEEGVEVSSLLVLTFTRSAAAEMKERLRTALAGELKKPGTDRRYVLTQLEALETASISTFDSFCGEVVRKNFESIGVDPEFVIADEAQKAILQGEAMEETIEGAYAALEEEDDPEMARFLASYGDLNDDRRIQEMVSSLYTFMRTQPDAETWAAKALANFKVGAEDFLDSPWGQALARFIDNRINLVRDAFRKAAALCEGGVHVKKFRETTYVQVTGEYQMIEAAYKLLPDYGAFITAVHGIEIPRFRGKQGYDQAVSDEIKGLRKDGKKILSEIQELNHSDLANSLALAAEMQGPMAAYLRLTQSYGEIYARKKDEKGLLDFNDVQHAALEVFSDPEIAASMRSQYHHVFMDEYQDVNALQETILAKILRGDNYFMVGDVKQSIYRFRLSDPAIFIEKYNSYTAAAGEQEESGGTLINLGRNFRSDSPIIDGVNQIFERIMSTGLGEIEYDERARLYLGRPPQGEGHGVELLILEEQKGGDPEDEETKIVAEARQIGNQILALVGEEFYDSKSGETRKMSYRDIGILMRNTSGKADEVSRVLTEMGIPTYFDGGDSYYDAPEILMILELLRLIDNHRQDRPLLAVMTSPIGGFTPEELSEIRIPDRRQGGFFYAAAEAYRDGGEDELAQKLKDFYARLAQWRRLSVTMDIEDFIWHLYNETGYYDFVGALHGGEQRQNNLRLLLKKAGDYKRSTLKGVFHFIQYVERMKKSQGDTMAPSVLTAQDNVVRIMSIHKSKGLEFPVVFVARVGDKFVNLDLREQVLIHKEMGLCPGYIDPEARVKMKSLPRNLCADVIKLENKSEEMRLLYVAMTRARERLFLVGTIKAGEGEKALKKWGAPRSLYSLQKSDCYLDWIMQALLAEKEEIPREIGVFTIHQGEFPPPEQSVQTGDDTEEEAVIPAEVAAEVHRRLSFVYPWRDETVLPGKITVTQAVHKGLVSEEPEERPEPLPLPVYPPVDTREISAADQGTALHRVLEALPLEVLADGAAIETVVTETIDGLVKKEILHPEVAATVNVAMIAGFLRSDVGQRLLASQQVRREMAFIYRLTPGEIDPAWAHSHEQLSLQGMIDAAFLEDGAWVILDYKTDRLYSADQRAERIARYSRQLELYARALADITGVAVKEKVLCLLAMEEYVRV